LPKPNTSAIHQPPAPLDAKIPNFLSIVIFWTRAIIFPIFRFFFCATGRGARARACAGACACARAGDAGRVRAWRRARRRAWEGARLKGPRARDSPVPSPGGCPSSRRMAGLAAPLCHSLRAARERRRCGQLFTGRGPRKEKEKEKPGTIRMLAGAFGPGASTRKSLQGNFPGDTRRGGATSWLLTQAAPQFPPWCRPRARAR
jgi:hypothetical protein